jgi:hypothetical protein
LHHALVHANPQARCDGLSNADAKGRRVHKTVGFALENGKKIKLTKSPGEEACRNLRSGEKFHQAGGARQN